MEPSGLIRLIRYFASSGHRYGQGIHSPLVFNLVSNVFRNKIDPAIVLKIEGIRKKMISDSRSILVNDLGTGSKRMKNSYRKVSDIVRCSAVSKKYGILLSNMSEAFGKPVLLEFGTSMGISTMYLAASCPEAIIYTMEGCGATSAIASENFKQAGYENIRLLNGSFDDKLKEFKSANICPGLVFIDGDHGKESLLRYFDQVVDISDNKTVVIIDDIYNNSGLAKAWNEIKHHDKVSVTVDIFKMGIVFFRQGISQFNYVIRY